MAPPCPSWRAILTLVTTGRLLSARGNWWCLLVWPPWLSAHSAEDRRDLFEAAAQSRREVLQRGQEVRMGHTGTQECPAQRLMLFGDELLAFVLGQLAARR